MRRFGMERIEVIASPEFCMARMIKALVCHDRTIGRTRPLCTDEETVASDEDIERLQRVIGYLEYKVFGNNAGENYPEFESLSRWIHWRLCLHFPGHSLVSRTGWTPAFVDGGIRDGVNFLSPFE